MKRIETGTPDRLRYREPCGRFVLLSMALWSIPVVVSGGMIAFILSSENYLRDVGKEVAGIVLLLELLFSGYYLFSIGRRYTRVGSTIDRRTGVVEPGCGFLFPVTTDALPLSRFHRLCIRTQEYQYLRMTEVKYQLTLEGVGEEQALIGRSREYMPVRMMAEEVGRFLGLDVLDATDEPPVQMRAETLGKSLKEQPQRGRHVRLIPPIGSALDAQVDEDSVRIALPRYGSLLYLVGCLLCAGVIAGFAGYLVATNLESGWLTHLFIVGLAGLLGLGALAGVEANLPKWIVVTADPERLLVTSQGLFGSSLMELPADQIREVRAGDETVTVFCADRAHYFAHARLLLEERKWIQDVLVYVLGGKGNLSSTPAIRVGNTKVPVTEADKAKAGRILSASDSGGLPASPARSGRADIQERP